MCYIEPNIDPLIGTGGFGLILFLSSTVTH
jgi:hypothetical protein